METSFIEYRDRTGIESESDTEIIDNSFTDESCAPTKTPSKKNQTVFVPESDETTTEDEDMSEANLSKSVARRSSVHQHVIVSSDDDKSKRGSTRRQSTSTNKVVLSSSDDECEASPEIMPRRRPKALSRSSESFIGRKTKKRIFLIDSDTENSIIIEHDRNRKLKCLKDTPAKIDNKDLRKSVIDIKNMSIQSNDTVQSDDDEQYSDKENESNDVEQSSDNENGNNDVVQSSDKENESDDVEQNSDNENESDDDKQNSDNENGSDDDKQSSDTSYEPNVGENNIVDKNLQHKQIHDSAQLCDDDSQISENDKEYHDNNHCSHAENVNSNIEHKYRRSRDDNQEDRHDDHNLCEENDEGDKSDNHSQYSSDAEGPDEDQMVMSRATRMSIMGFLPKENESDDSDYLQSDDGIPTSRGNSFDNLTEPSLATSVNKTPEKVTELKDTSRLSCSPIQSPLHDITNEINNAIDCSTKSSPDVCDLTRSESYSPKNRVLNTISESKVKFQENIIDDDVTIIDTKPEIIALSSDDEDEVKDEKKSPKTKIKPKTEETSIKKDNTIKQYLLPPSYPNQVMYVKKNVRENELSKLNGLKEDLQNIKYLLEHMDVNTLPDGGLKLIERLTALEAEVRRQGDKVANMVVEPDQPTFEDMAKDGFDKENKGPSWDDLKKASNAVQPRMFGKQAMSTHMAERNLILDRLRDLYESLASRPPEHEMSAQPPGLTSDLMLHQRHALAWLHWRETQRPRGGILADDMGLGKTITMIAVIVSDKGKNIDHDNGNDDERGRSKLCVGGTLVVCPASLMQQWAGEVSLHCRPHALALCLHHGAQRATQPHRLAAYDLVLTTYNILQRESEKGGVLTRVRWRRVILDEAHVVRNHKSSTSLGVCSLAAAARWALTGTPLHNKDLDLFALLKFLRCTPFDDLAMWKKWIDNKSLGGQERLNTIMRCIMLRRTKQLLQEKGQLTCLPQRTVHKCDVTLFKEEMTVYQKVLVFSKTLFAQFLHQRAERAGEAPKGNDSEYHKMHKKMIALQGTKPVKSHEILVLLLRLRQVCCHCGLIAAMLEHGEEGVVVDQAGPDLLEELNKLTLDDAQDKRKSNGKKEDDEPIEESTTAAEAIRSVLSPNNPVFDLERHSSKIEAVMDCLDKNVFPNKGEKAVVVSQWTSVLRLVAVALDARRVRCVTLSGAVPVAARGALVRSVNDPASDVKVMLLSLCAGGVGLNLCGANHLLLLDPHWNPQLEEQAQDRIYRVGQTRHVHIYRFMCVGTVEQTIRKLQDVKLKMADSVLTGARNTNASKLTIEDLKMLFNMGPQPDS